MTTLPTVVTSAGLQPQTPASLYAQIIAGAQALEPGITANLPGSLIDDVTGTDTACLVLCDSARVETVDSVSPYSANDWMLTQLGNIYGVPIGQATNTSVYVTFSGTVGFTVPVGFTVGDGTYQYIVQDGGIIGSSGSSAALFCVATVSGSWAVPSGTVTNLITSVPTGITLTCTNLTDGVAATEAQTSESYRADVLQGGLAVAQGMTTFLKTQLRNVSGVQQRLVSVAQNANDGTWKVIVGGGDPYEVANAIFTGLFDVNAIAGSTLSVTAITQANPGVVTTDLNHGFATGQVITITGIVGMTELNGLDLTITVIDEKNFSVGVNTSSYTAYVSGGVVSPNLRNVTVSIQDYPDVYQVVFVNPPEQTVAITATWNTTETNFVSQSAVTQAAQPALVDYINSIPAGQPINEDVMISTFQTAVAAILPAALLTRLVFAVSINGVSTSPSSGTAIIIGDPESYFSTSDADVNVTQG